ncbi:MAG: cation:proton antiporter [Magnetococcales bacterium]|nr:cation:proton antiporter [Magnetococcales bacterium]MBF0151057.1 cation:proton antiporter [Magnetococcales bacterium]
MSEIAIFFSQALLVVGLPYLVWRIPGMRRVVPLVVLQILLGLALGPSIFGKYSPELSAILFSEASMQRLMGPSWLAIVLFTFLTGLHWQTSELKPMGWRLAWMSVLSFLVPCILGVLTGMLLAYQFPETVGQRANVWQFAIAIGLSISVTALPVLGAILREMELMEHPLGRISLGMAALNDAILWFFLSILLAGLVNDGGMVQETLMIPVEIGLYLVVMLFVIKPLLRWILKQCDIVGDAGLVAVFISVFGSALATEQIGLHAALGGFMIGIIIPRPFKHFLIERLEPLTVVLLLPFFFAMTGMKTSFDITSNTIVSITLIAIVMSMVGKFIGTTLPARRLGENWPDSIAIGILMQTKGMMEVLLLTIFRDAHIISPTCFSAMMFMAIITTSLTMPMLRLVMPWISKAPAAP